MEKWRKLLEISVNPIRRNGVFVVLNQRFLHEGPDTVEELLDRHVVKKKEKIYDSDEDELSLRRRLTSTRREALSLYRDILRATRFFVWPDARGVLWRDVLRDNARREFEEARFEKDPEIITRLLIGGRDAVQSALDKLVERQKQQMMTPEDQRNRDHHH
ncbi:Complex 1 LYR protein [Macleaya cordata]|uniref:Complex 1 LYR protein n=1 Tax=Macleaya cordata TaxID=56857 RepID=A0A200QZR7_MACCD|nr:Complex 1 LYR protein [Macleaya cordata]